MLRAAVSVVVGEGVAVSQVDETSVQRSYSAPDGLRAISLACCHALAAPAAPAGATMEWHGMAWNGMEWNGMVAQWMDWSGSVFTVPVADRRQSPAGTGWLVNRQR